MCLLSFRHLTLLNPCSDPERQLILFTIFQRNSEVINNFPISKWQAEIPGTGLHFLLLTRLTSVLLACCWSHAASRESLTVAHLQQRHPKRGRSNTVPWFSLTKLRLRRVSLVYFLCTSENPGQYTEDGSCFLNSCWKKKWIWILSSYFSNQPKELHTTLFHGQCGHQINTKNNQ